MLTLNLEKKKEKENQGGKIGMLHARRTKMGKKANQNF